MAQGKLKVKTKLPDKVKNKSIKKVPGSAVTKRANRPEKSKKKSNVESQKLKQIITKTVNKSLEDEIRQRASSSSKTKLSKAQQAVASHNTSN